MLRIIQQSPVLACRNW